MSVASNILKTTPLTVGGRRWKKEERADDPPGRPFGQGLQLIADAFVSLLEGLLGCAFVPRKCWSPLTLAVFVSSSNLLRSAGEKTPVSPRYGEGGARFLLSGCVAPRRPRTFADTRLTDPVQVTVNMGVATLAALRRCDRVLCEVTAKSLRIFRSFHRLAVMREK